ncbi:non-ribosomal peptide synthetase [Solilutibacter pythonis]|nr:non-ribosomal peptide synthetase [Lysobacter pythonis]
MQRVLTAQQSELDALLHTLPDFFDWRPLAGNARSLWFLYRVTPTSAAWHCAAVLDLSGDVTEAQLIAACERLCDRHPMLRARFGEREGEPCYRIEAVHANKWRHFAPVETFETARSALLDEADAPFALEQGEVMRASTVRVGDRLLVSLVLHHIIADFYSAEVLVRELVCELQKQPVNAPTSDYEHWQRECAEYLVSARGKNSLAYWQQLLQDAPVALDLPIDFARPAQRTWTGERLDHELPAALCMRVRSLAAELQVTPYTILLATYLLWLWKLSGQDDFVVGTPTLGRHGARHRSIVGYLANPMAVRAQMHADSSFIELVAMLKSQLEASRRHQRYPLAQLLEDLAIPRRADQASLFQHFFTYSQARHEWGDALGLEVLHMGMRGAAHELILTVFEDGDRLRCQIGYNDALYASETAQEWLLGYSDLLAAVVREPGLNVGAVTWGGQPQPGESGADIDAGPTHAIARIEATPGTRIALLESDRTVDFETLRARARNLAGALQAHGGDVVAVALPRSAAQVTAMLAAWYAGQAWLALDMQLPDERLGFMVEDSGARLVLGEGARPSWLPETAQWQVLDTLSPAPYRPIAHDPDALAYLIYTSGSTGQPKGVAVTHANLCGYVTGMLERVRPSEDAVFTTLATVSADLGHTSLFGALLSGRAFRLIGDEWGRDPNQLAEHLERHPVDVLKIVPSHLQALLVVDRPQRVLPREVLICGGEALPWTLVERVGALSPQCRVFNHYGPTETTVGATCIDVAQATRGTPSVAIGTPLPGYHTLVLDARGSPVPRGGIGELYIGGAGVANGYWKRDDLTAERFLPDPRDPQARMYRSGDRVRRLASGELVFLGRMDDQVKIRGYRVEPGEIEQRLRSLEGVEQAVVIVQEGGNGARLMACYRGEHIDPLAALRASLPDYLLPVRCLRVEVIPVTANGKVDRAALCALLDAPVEAGGEIATLDEFELRLVALWQPLFPGIELGPDSSFFSLGGDSIDALRLVAEARKHGMTMTPAMLVETPTLRELAERIRPDANLRERLRGLWCEVLQLDHVAADADFFALGGDSIAALKLVAAARNKGLDISPLRLLEHRTVATLAADLAQYGPRSMEQPSTDLEPFALISSEDREQLRHARSDAVEAFPLSPLQEGLLYNALASPESGHYVSQQVLHLNGDLDLASLRAAWQTLQERHESLRLGFDWEHASRPVQWLRTQPTDAWREQDCSAHDSAWIQRELSLLCESERAKPFVLDEPGLVRLYAVVAGREETWLIFTVHHLIIDRWSAVLLLEELAALYRGERLPAAPRYRDYIAWLETQPSEPEIRFWREQLLDHQGGKELPVAATPATGTYVTEARLGASETRALRECAARLQVPVASVLQAVWAVLLSRYTNSADVCFGLTVSGRPPALAQADRMAGLFINTVPMRVRLRAEQTLAQLCLQVRDQSFALQAHDRLPLAQIAAAAGYSNGAVLFRSLLVIENIRFDNTVSLGDGVICERVHATSATHFPLLVQLTPEDESLHVLLQSQRAEVDDEFVDSVLADWQRLLREFAQCVENPVAGCGLVPAREWPRWIALGQGETPRFAHDTESDSLAQCVERVVEAFPDLPALAGEGATLSYAALNRRANQLAHHLRECGVGPGVRVGLVADRSVAITVALLAVLKAGGAYVPLDPEYPAARIAFILDDAQCRLVLACGTVGECTSDFNGSVIDLDDAAFDEVLAHQPDTNPRCEHDADSAAYLIYTSGSTGQPKGVVVPHRGPLHLMLATQSLLPAAPGDRVLQFTGLYFDMSVLEWLCAWTQGACLQLIAREATRSGEQLLDYLADKAITHLIAQPAVLAPLTPPPLSSLRHVLLAGDVCPDELAARWGEGRTFHNAYGPTEASVIVTADRFVPGRKITLGRPLPHAQCHVLDWAGQPCRPGLVGELHLAGAYLASGYQGLPEETAAAFRTPKHGPLAGIRLYATGDRVRLLEDGRLEFLGRRDSQVKIRGQRIELAEIEAVLRKQDEVDEAVVLVHRHGSDNACLVAFVQGKAAPATLRSALRDRLPSHLIPAHIECVDTLPQTPSRKIDRRALAGQVEDVLRPIAPEMPRSATEQRLQRLWQTLFNRDPIGVIDDFFALGGHSLLATRLAGLIAQEFELRLDLRRLFATTTIREQAQLIDALFAVQASTESAEPIIESGFL